MSSFTHALSTNNYGPAKFIVDPSAANGTHTTIGAALTSASSGDTIFIRPSSYTENLTLKAGVNLTAYNCDSQNGTVIIVGKCTFTTAGTVCISGIRLQTNSDYLVETTGSNNSILYFNNCYFNMTNNTGFHLTSSGVSSHCHLYECIGDLGTTGIGIFTNTQNMDGFYSRFTNSGASTTASTTSALAEFHWSSFSSPFSTSGSGRFQAFYTEVVNSSTNAICLTTAGTNLMEIDHSYFSSGSASAISIGTGTTLNIYNCYINSTNTNPITGAGTLTQAGLTFIGSGRVTNVTTQGGGSISGMTNGNAPATFYLGEQIRSFVGSGAAMSVSTNTPKSIASISLTAGIWDVSALVGWVAAGSTSVVQKVISISQTNNVLSGNPGDDEINDAFNAIVGGQTAQSIPAFRITLSATTTIYLVVQAGFSISTLSAYGRISGTRVG